MPGAHAGAHGHAPYPRAAAEYRAGDRRQTPASPSARRGGRRQASESDAAPPIMAVEGVTFAYQDGTVALRDLSLTSPGGAGRPSWAPTARASPPCSCTWTAS